MKVVFGGGMNIVFGFKVKILVKEVFIEVEDIDFGDIDDRVVYDMDEDEIFDEEEEEKEFDIEDEEFGIGLRKMYILFLYLMFLIKE